MRVVPMFLFILVISLSKASAQTDSLLNSFKLIQTEEEVGPFIQKLVALCKKDRNCFTNLVNYIISPPTGDIKLKTCVELGKHFYRTGDHESSFEILKHSSIFNCR